MIIQYCAVRRQFGSPEETQVLDYQLVQARIFVPLVQAFACHYSAFLFFCSPPPPIPFETFFLPSPIPSN